MPNDWGVYEVGGTEGTEVSSTYGGRHITCTAAELLSTSGAGTAIKGVQVVFGLVGLQAVGVAFNSGTTTDLIAIDTEGIWNLAVSAIDDGGAMLISAGDPLYINVTNAVISKIRNNATQVPFGYALAEVAAAAVAYVCPVKVHWDPRSHWLLDEEMLYFGDARDVSMEWDVGLTALEVLPLVNNTGSIRIGDGTFSMDVQIFGDLAGGANYMLYDSSESVLEVVNTISDGQDVIDSVVTEIGTHTGDSSAFHGALTKNAGAITGAGSVSAGRFDVVPRANCSHVYAVKTYTGCQAQGPTVGDMSAYYCYCDNLGADNAGFNAYSCLMLNIDSTAKAAGAGNSFFYLYSHGAAADQYFYIPDLQGATYMFNWPTAIVAPVEVNADVIAGNETHRIACLVGGALRYIKLSSQ